MGQKNFWAKNVLGEKKFRIKKYFWSKRFGSEIFFLKKTGRVKPRGVKIVLGCCLFCLVRLPTKFQTSRIILSGRSRVPFGGWGV